MNMAYNMGVNNSMGKLKIIIYAICLEVLIIFSIFLANKFTFLFYLFYNGIFGIFLCTIIPLIIIIKCKENIFSVGIKKLFLRQWIILITFIVFSICGQIIPLINQGIKIRFNLLPICIFPMIMTTFFEEFLFRGFLQTKIEKDFGFITAIIISGLLFSLYHIGYPGYRNINDLLTLFCVGTGFAIAFKLSNNNLIVVYFVNLPNALVTYILKSEKFPALTIRSSIFAIVTIILILIILVIFNRKTNNVYNKEILWK